jgi:hypothetical protein
MAFLSSIFSRLIESLVVMLSKAVTKWIEGQVVKEKIKKKNKAVTEKTLKANTKEERDLAASNTINNV